MGATNGQHTGADAVFSFLGWTAGHFEFTRGTPESGAALEQSFSELLLEGCRRLDEQRRVY